MWKVIGVVATAAAAAINVKAAELTAIETRWLKGAWPVVVFARDTGLPLDIVVQPQPTPGAAPLALAYVDGRCKLVLSMRGNPEAEATLARIEPDVLDATLELMAAHELGHCRRYVEGAWYRAPAGFAAAAGPHAADADTTAARREEGYGDLVGLAWTQWQHPAQYARLYGWLLEQRSHGRLPGGPHDTLVWLRLACDGAALAQAPTIFAASAALWTAALANDAAQAGEP